MKERIARITERWFLSEEPLFSAFCTHRVAENREMACYARVGKGVIEVNPDLCKDISDKELEERLRVEVIRILLKHPYDRQPDGCCNTARALGSNCVIGDSYRLQKIEMEKPADFEMPSNQHFEYYARKWCLRSESNQRHADFQSAALPTELQRHIKLHVQLDWRPRRGSNPRPPA